MACVDRWVSVGIRRDRLARDLDVARCQRSGHRTRHGPTLDYDAPDRVDIDTRRDLIVERAALAFSAPHPRASAVVLVVALAVTIPLGWPGRRPLGPAHDERVTISQAWACLLARMLAVTRLTAQDRVPCHPRPETDAVECD